MNISLEKRKEIQKTLEEFVRTQPSFKDKRFVLTILSFIYELNQYNAAAITSDNEIACLNKSGICLWQLFKQIQNTLSTLDIPDNFDETFLSTFTVFAHNINSLAGAVNNLSELLHLRYAERFPSEIPLGAIKQ